MLVLVFHDSVACLCFVFVQLLMPTILIGQEVQHFHDALELKDSEIYLQRARNMYEATDVSHTSLFQFTMSGMKVRFVFDPTMVGHKKLTASVRNMDPTR